jgi:hypothetical protein
MKNSGGVRQEQIRENWGKKENILTVGVSEVEGLEIQ